MEVDWFENVATSEEMLPVDADNDSVMFEGERCGICMDIIIDRGVLDCCQHWFCFACIDNWSTITNLCPLCQNEFQLITCVPVYDTIGGNNTDEDSFSRDDDWSVEGKNNTLSFPSYYIDENAVTCLDGDGCKLRIGSVTPDENLTFDTSIACDSCDIWYHAFCVGFDTESTSVESWLCPRCLVDEAYKLDANGTELGQNHHSGSAENQCSSEIFSGKVSISVADDGETAMVVSMVDQKNLVEEPTGKSLTADCLGFVNKDNFAQSRRSTTSETSSDNPLTLSSQNITNDLPSSEAGDIGLSAPTDMAPGSTSSSDKLKPKFEDNVMFDELNVSSIKCPQSIKKETSEDHATLRPDEGSVVGENVKSIPIGADERQHCSLPIGSCHTSAKERNAQADVLMAVGEKRRRKDYSSSAHASDRKRVRLATEGLSKETKAEKSAEGTSVVGQPDNYAFNRPEEVGHDRICSRDEREQLESAEEATSVDIISIVQGKESKILCRNPAITFSERRDVVGPRVKKIVRRPVEDKESMVQNLRKEIREAIRNKSSEDVGRSIFDPKLLAAFRAAVAVPDTQPLNKVSASVVKAKNLMLRKGKTRENLTKKIYATASGKRRQAWYRDCQIDFWKHRCPKTTKFEKIETLKSVLGLLKMDPEAKKAEWKPKEEASNAILSRLYLADASVFPRKDDIKPLSSLETSSTHVSTSTEDTKADKTGKTHSLNSAPLKSNTSYLDGKKNKSTSISSKGAQTGTAEKASACLSADSAINTQKGKIDKPDDIKTDKRKWALQVLARKTSSNSTSPGHQNQEKDAALKGNYPLLAQLPVDMRPNPESCRHNKIPNSVRQAQLYRLAENLLRLTNISPIRKTAATELAVADAINIERELANRSKSKVVYLNLCSQELKRHKTTDSENPVEDSNPSTLPAVSTEEEPSNSSLSLDSDVEKALRNAGLLPDSPSSGTFHGVENLNDEDDNDEAKDRLPDNFLEMDSHPELDIFGEFEYDIQDEDYIGASAIKEPKLQTEEGESKLKVVFSTLVMDKRETTPNSEPLESLIVELASSCASQSDCKTDANYGSFIKVGNEESLTLPPDSITEGVEEPTHTECEELYGPDKEPLFASFPFSNHPLAPGVKSSEVESGKQDAGSSDAKVSSSVQPKENENNPLTNVGKQEQETDDAVTKKVQAYIKEHIRPLCKSGVISVDQYRWAVGKTTDKVMKYHSKAKNANFLIKEGEKVKKLAEQYVEAAQVKDKDK